MYIISRKQTPRLADNYVYQVNKYLFRTHALTREATYGSELQKIKKNNMPSSQQQHNDKQQQQQHHQQQQLTPSTPDDGLDNELLD